MTFKKTALFTAALAGLALASTSAHASLIINGDFVSHGAGNNAPFVDPGGDWTTSGSFYHYNDNNLGTGDYVYVWGTASVDQDVSAAWTTADTIDISLISAITSWGGGSGSVLVELRKASDDTVLWSDTGAVTSSVTSYDWSIDANTLAATEGEDLNLKITATGNGTAVDDVTLDVVPVPEPSSLALLGLGGLLIARRRRG